MGQRMPAQKHNPFQNDSNRPVVAIVVWWKDVMVGIVAPRRRDGRSALIEVARGSQPTPARRASCASVCRHWRDLRLAVEWALPELEFEDVRRIGGGFVGVDIGEVETPDGGSGRGIDFRPEGGQRPEKGSA